MLERMDFEKKQVIFLFTNYGEKLSFQNDNLIVKDHNGKVIYQITCYRIFILFVVGEVSITSGLIQRAKKFEFVICLMNRSFKLYSIVGNRMEGNTILHRKQYKYQGDDIARFIVKNKITNQCQALKQIRNKTELCKEAIKMLEAYIDEVSVKQLTGTSLLGVEGSAARVYFPQIFDKVKWNGRKPRIKNDYINTTLDIGYNLLFNIVDSMLQVYGFDVYCGVYHREFYMRKSLACDIMEPMRPIVDTEIRKAINLGQCRETDFECYQNQYVLSYSKTPA